MLTNQNDATAAAADALLEGVSDTAIPEVLGKVHGVGVLQDFAPGPSVQPLFAHIIARSQLRTYGRPDMS